MIHIETCEFQSGTKRTKFIATLSWHKLSGTEFDIEFKNEDDKDESSWSKIGTFSSTILRKKNLDSTKSYKFRVKSTDASTTFEESPIVIAPKINPLVEQLFGTTDDNTIVDKNYATIDLDTLHGKVLMLYFSASWCPPCRMFTPELGKYYHLLREAGKNVEIIFVSSDRSERDYKEYYQKHHGDYYAIDYQSDKREELGTTFGIQGIPSLVVLGSQGKIIERQGTRKPMSLAQFEEYRLKCNR